MQLHHSTNLNRPAAAKCLLLPVDAYANMIKWHGRLNENGARRNPFNALNQRGEAV
jgi:hypothetical protein